MNRGEGEFEQSGEYKHSSTLQHRHTFQLATYTCRTCNWFQMKPLTLDIMTISTSWSLVKLVIWFVIAYMPSTSRRATMGNLLLWSSFSPAPSSTQTWQQILSLAQSYHLHLPTFIPHLLTHTTYTCQPSFPTCSLIPPTLANLHSPSPLQKTLATGLRFPLQNAQSKSNVGCFERCYCSNDAEMKP